MSPAWVCYYLALRHRASEIKEEEPPGLEFIEGREVDAPPQGMDAGPFITLVEQEQTLSCGEQGKASTKQSPPASPTSTPLATPDLIQARKTPPHCKEEPKKREILSPPPTPSSSAPTSCCPHEDAQPKGVNDDSPLRPSSILRLLSLHTPQLGQTQDFYEGSPVSPLYLRKPSILFPVFGAR